MSDSTEIKTEETAPVTPAPEAEAAAPAPEPTPEPAPEVVSEAAPEPAPAVLSEAAPAVLSEADPEAATEPEAKPEPEPEPEMRPEHRPRGENEPVITIRGMLEAGVHFGHQTTRWNPKMRPYIYGSRNGIHIIDLQLTQPKFMEAYNFVVKTVSAGHSVLFVGTKKQAQDVIREEAERCGQFYVTNRWLGGTLTNWRTVRTSIDRLKRIEQMAEDGTFEKLSKKEVLSLERARMKLERNLGGIKNLDRVPGIMFVIDPRKEKIAIAEAKKLDIQIVAITDTNCNPDQVNFVIPGNDDAIRSIRLFTSRIAEAVLMGKRIGQERAAAVARDREATGANATPEPIRVHSGGDGPKVEVVSRRSGPRPAPEAAASPEREGE